MAIDKSRAGLLEFLDYLAKKGLMTKNTVAARKASASKVLGILSNEEANDVTDIDLNSVMMRFQNLEGNKYTPSSLNTYQSRTKSALEDFAVYLKNPMAYKPNVPKRERAEAGNSSINSSPVKRTSTGKNRAETEPPTPPGSSIMPIPIRQDVTVHIQGLPFDLTEQEAGKIANVIRAMAMPV